jgi:predicted TIM-barrel fold metal-dependent hydrolase
MTLVLHYSPDVPDTEVDMLPVDAKLISVDDHVIEHRDVWQDRLAARYKPAGPRIEMRDGIPIWVYEGRDFPPLGLDAVAGHDPTEFALTPKRFAEMRPGCYDPKARLVDMDEDGVTAQLCFPQFPRFAGQTFAEAHDKELARLCVQAWNDFMIDEWCATDPLRFIPLAIVPLWDPKLAAAEIERVAPRGARAITFTENPVPLGLPSFWSGHWDPMFSALEDAGMPMCLHIGSSSKITTPSADVAIAVPLSLMALNSMTACSDLVFSPVFDRHPRLRVVFSEGGSGWAPYLLEKMDYTWERHRHYNEINRDQRPSEVFDQHIWVAHITDQVGTENRHRIGIHKMLWESDYPHSDSLWPQSRAVVAEHLKDVPDEEARMLVELNARSLFRFHG